MANIDTIFYFDESLLTGSNGEQNFEQAKCITWLKNIRQKTFDCRSSSTLIPRLYFDQPVEVPFEAVLTWRYATKLMKLRGEEYFEDVWCDRFVGAEVYIQLLCLQKSLQHVPPPREATEMGFHTSWGEVISRKRRKAICFTSPIPNSRTPSPNSSPIPPVDTENGFPQSTDDLVDLDGVAHASRRVEKHDRHLIDVSNVFTEETMVNSAELHSSPANQITQFFSPHQVQELLMKNKLFNRSPNSQEGVDPWCPKFVDAFWEKVSAKLTTWSGYNIVQDFSPPESTFTFGDQCYVRRKRLGSQGTIWIVMNKQTNNVTPNSVECIARVVKLQCCDFPLEFYQMREARRRVGSAFISGQLYVDVRPSICPALAATSCLYSFSALLMPYFPVGLLNWLNFSATSSNRLSRANVPTMDDRPGLLERFEEELCALYLTIELLWLAEGLHKHARMIHGDIKPDNFRLCDRFPLLDLSSLDEISLTETEDCKRPAFSDCLVSGRSTKVLVLIDFGLCIDMARFPKEITFQVQHERIKKRSFPCIEMLTGKTWTYQLDLFNIAGVIYTMVFKRYMAVQCRNGVWQPTGLPRSSRNYKARDIWEKVVLSLMNVPSCAPEDYPDLSTLRGECERFLLEHATAYNMAVERANQIMAFLNP